MKLLEKVLMLLLLTVCCAKVSFAQAVFEGTLKTRVTMAGVDMSVITEKIDYSKGDLGGQIATLYKSSPAQDLSRLQALTEQNPMMGLALAMTPPQATIHVKDKVVFARTKGLGYEIQHYHNLASDEAFLYTASLVQPGEQLTASYKPSDGYEALFTGDKRITTDNFNVDRSGKVATVAGYACAISTYTSKSLQANSGSATGIPSLEVRKLMVYTSKDLPKGLNFSHPYYLPEDHGIMRIDIYLDNGPEPTMVYEMVSVKKVPISDNMFIQKKSAPLYALTDTNYGMKLFGIMIGGMAAMGSGDNDEGDK